MPLMHKVANWVSRTEYGRKALNEPGDLGLFKQRPSPGVILGLVLLGVSYLIGWPVVGLTAVLAAYYREPLILLIGGPAVYGLSWVVFGVSMLLLGVHSYRGAAILGHYLTRHFLVKYVHPLQSESDRQAF